MFVCSNVEESFSESVGSVVSDSLGWNVVNIRKLTVVYRKIQVRGTLSIVYHREEFLYALWFTVPCRQIYDGLLINAII